MAMCNEYTHTSRLYMKYKYINWILNKADELMIDNNYIPSGESSDSVKKVKFVTQEVFIKSLRLPS